VSYFSAPLRALRETKFFRAFVLSPALSQTLSKVEGSEVEGCFRDWSLRTCCFGAYCLLLTAYFFYSFVIDPLEVRLAAGDNRQGDDLRHFVGMHASDFLFKV